MSLIINSGSGSGGGGGASPLPAAEARALTITAAKDAVVTATTYTTIEGINLTQSVTYGDYAGFTNHVIVFTYVGTNLSKAVRSFLYEGSVWTNTTNLTYRLKDGVQVLDAKTETLTII